VTRRGALLLLLACGAACADASCLLPVPADKGRRLDQDFQHLTLSPGGFFGLHWNSSGDSALAAERVPAILAALDAAQDHYLALPGAWEIPLGPRAHYPVLALPQSVPGATTLPFSLNGVDGLSWIQLDTRPEAWGGDADLLLEAVCAHEVFHAFQFAQGADLRNLAFYESSAVWAEDQVFPDHDDWARRYLPALLERLPGDLDDTGGLREYGAGAIVKHLLAGEGHWGPCRDALRGGATTGRCWPLLLDSLAADAETELAACLSELLGAGVSGLARRVPELADLPTLDRGGFPVLDAAVGVPLEAQVRASLSWQALAPAPGVWRGAGQGLYHVGEAGGDPAPLEDSLWTVSDGRDWLLLVNAGEEWLPGLQWVQALEGAASFRVWPDPGGRARRIEFAGPARTLRICNLLGQQVGRWTPPGPGPGPFPLELPPAASGPLFLLDGDGHGIRVLVLRGF
jgi:hypothetical protein